MSSASMLPMNSAVVRHEDFAKLPPRLDAAWVKFLVVRGLQNDEIGERLGADDLPDCSDEALEGYRRELVVPANYMPGSETHLASRAFEHRHHVEMFFRKNGIQAEQVLHILRSRRARELIEAALLVGVPLQAVVHILRERLSFRTTPTTLIHYARVFFTIDDVARVQLRALVEARVRQSVVRLVGNHDPKAIRRAVAADARVVAMTMPSSRLAWAATMLAFGWPPPPQDLASSMGEIEKIATVRAHQAAARGGRDDDRRALAFAAVIEKVQAIKSNLGAPTAAIREALQVRLLEAESTVTVGELLERGDEIGTAEPCPGDDRDADKLLAIDDPSDAPSNQESSHDHTQDPQR